MGVFLGGGWVGSVAGGRGVGTRERRGADGRGVGKMGREYFNAMRSRERAVRSRWTDGW